MEAASLSFGAGRVKYNSVLRSDLKDSQQDPVLTRELSAFGDLLMEMEACGAAPLLPDGKVAGNGAFISSQRSGVFVSRSGKEKGARCGPEDFVLLHHFDAKAWKAEFSSYSGHHPSSDSPLLWSSLHMTSERYGWVEQPRVALHGHALADEESAMRLGIPISSEETLFSTREDLESLESLFCKHPYPSTQIYIRKNHGFFLLAPSLDAAKDLFHNRIAPYTQSLSMCDLTASADS